MSKDVFSDEAEEKTDSPAENGFIADDFVFTMTVDGLDKINQYISELEEKRKELLDSHKDTAEDTLPAVQDIVNDVQFAFDPEYNDYCNNWGVTDNYDSDYPLQLELNTDFVKTYVLRVDRHGDDHDDDAWVVIKQGNRIGSFVTTVGEIEACKDSFLEAEREFNKLSGKTTLSDVETVTRMMKLGQILVVPNLKTLPLIDEQSFVLQDAYRLSRSSNFHMGVTVSEKNIVIDTDRYLPLHGSFGEYVQAMKDEVVKNPNLEFVIKFGPADSSVTIYPEISQQFASWKHQVGGMIREMEDALREITSDSSTKEAGKMTLEEALNKRGVEKEDFMEQMDIATKSKILKHGSFVVNSSISFDTQEDRKNAVKLISGWMKKPGKKIASEIEEIKARGNAQGR